MRNWLRLVSLLAVAAAPANSQPQQSRPGDFDYYLFTLSWSPEYCYSHRDAEECTSSRHYAFIVHGLWPQFSNGRYPERCSTEPAPERAQAVSEIMPDRGLVRHEWTTHGTCSGLPAEQYFGLIRKVYDSIQIPGQFADPNRSFNTSPMAVKRAFSAANPKLTPDSLAVSCPREYLSGIEICVTKQGSPMRCPAGSVRDCRAGSIKVAGVR